MSSFDDYKVKFLNICGGDIPDDQYFAIPGISNSKLKLIDPLEGGSPEAYLAGFPKEFNVSTLTGSSVHEMFLQQADYQLSDYEGKPSAKLGYFIDCIYEARQKGETIENAIYLASQRANYYAGKLTPKIIQKALRAGLDYYMRRVRGEFVSEGKEVIVLPKAQLEACKACLNSLYNNYSVKQLLSENLLEPKQFLNEIALFSDIEVTFPDGETHKIPFKGKLDQVIIDPEKKIIYLNDLKTTSKSCEVFMGGIYEGEWFNGSWQKFHYFRQFSVYLLMLQMYCEQVLNLTDYNYMCNVIVVETTGENRAKVYPINNSYIQYGAKEFKELICRVAWHERYGFDKTIEERID